MKVWHGVVAVLGLFVLGMVPLLLTFSSAESGLVMRQILGNAALTDEGAGNVTSVEVAPARAAWPSADSLDCPSVDLRLLVVAADGNEASLASIRETLEYLGTPYTVYLAAENPGGLTPDKLSNGCRGFYGGVILTSGDVAYDDGRGSTRSALTSEEWGALEEYEATFDVRRVAWYAYPNSQYGFKEPTQVGVNDAIPARLTDAGGRVFDYVNPDNPITIDGAYTYLAKPEDQDATPLLSNSKGHALAVEKTHPDGRETLALTFDSAPRLLHSQILAYGLINWVTQDLFLGERRVYMSAQIDDLFLPNKLYNGESYRITGDDLQTVLDWQGEKQDQPITEQLRLDMAFNAYGTRETFGRDTLTPLALETQDQFKWVNHTYKHLDMDELDYASSLSEIEDNDDWASESGLKSYDPANLITPEHSGLESPEVLQAAYDAGVRYMVGDSSRAEYEAPSPNAGIYHPLQPSILLIPRYPNNLYFDVSTPEEWVDEYNENYRELWGRDLSYDEVLDKESEVLLSYLLKGDVSPLMFHQANLRAYDGANTLLGDLLDRTLEKYEEVFILPILSPTMDDLGRRVAERMQYNEAGVTASISPGKEITLTASEAVRVPVTGLSTAEAEPYGGQYTSYVDLEAGESVTLPLG